ncbi:MAG: hypothetical protein PWP31_438 [Clostridia bacterium]|nr:hypothetical protein [Clostridia bacterium]
MFYGWLWWQYRNSTERYPCLVLVVSECGGYLEGILRRFLRWRFWRGSPPMDLWIIADTHKHTTLGILRCFDYPYPPFKLIYAQDGISLKKIPTNDNASIHLLDIRQDNFDSANAKLNRIIS